MSEARAEFIIHRSSACEAKAEQVRQGRPSTSEAVRPINILTVSRLCIVLRVRENLQEANHAVIGAHLENCTGRHSEKHGSAEDSSQKRGRVETHKGLPRPLNSLRRVEATEGSLEGESLRGSWQDQAKKSAGWMPGH